MTDVPTFVGIEFDFFVRKPTHSAVEETIDTIYKPIPSVEQIDLDFLIPADLHTYVDLDIKLYVKGQLVKPDGSALDNTDFAAGKIITFILFSVNVAFL